MKPLVCHLSSVHVRSDVRVFYKECVSLVNAGYRVRLIVADGKGNEYRDGVKIHDLGKPQGRFSRILFAPLKLFIKAVQTKAELYHFHDPELLPVGLLLKWCTRAKVIYDAHESYPDDMLYKDYLPVRVRWFASHAIRLLEDFTAKRMDAVITVTDYHNQRFARLNPSSRTVCNYPLLSEWQPLLSENPAKEPCSVCYVGNITRKRGLSVLIKALINMDVTLHLAGGYEPASYRDELLVLPGWKKVKEYGYLDRQQAVKLMGASLVGVMLFQPEPNHINSLSTKVFEYMAAGCAVLVSDFPVYRSLIGETNCGKCVNPENPLEVAQAISDLLQNPENAYQMGQRGRQLILEKYHWETQERTLLDLYNDLLKSWNL